MEENKEKWKCVVANYLTLTMTRGMTGCSKQTSMPMEVSAQGGKRNFTFGLTLQHSTTTTASSGTTITYCSSWITSRYESFQRGGVSDVYPSKPMSVYATIWDGSEWATHGGKYPVNYKYAPFVASFTEMELGGCVWDPTASVPSCVKDSVSRSDPVEGQEFVQLSNQQIVAMDWARRKLMFYSYCKDTRRFKVMPPECK